MKAHVNIPAPYTAEAIQGAMATLRLDPNFAALCAMMKANDIASMEADLIDGKNHMTGAKLSDEETAELRYRRGVFTELLTMPETIIEAMKTEQAEEREEERLDPYSTAADIEEDRKR